MNSAIGIYDTHDKAVEAVKKLKESNFPPKQLSIMGRADVEVVDEEMHIQSKNPINPAGVGIGTTVGAALGILTGVGVFAIPGLGFLYGAGALVGAIAGIDFGLIGGGIASVLTTVGVKDEEHEHYKKELEEGKYILVAQGSEEEVKQAKEILERHGQYSHASIH